MCVCVRVFVCVCVCVRSACVCVCVCVCARARVDIRNTLLRNNLRKIYDKKLSEMRLGMCQKTRFGGEIRMPESKTWVPEVYRKKMVRCIRYRKFVSGLTENEAGV